VKLDAEQDEDFELEGIDRGLDEELPLVAIDDGIGYRRLIAN
jgi:hypothetical protein